MRAFTRAILMGRIGASELDLVAKIRKSVANFVAFAEFTTTIHTDILLEAIGGIVSKPAVKPIDRGCFSGERASEDTATVVVSDEDVACFAVEAHEIIKTFGITATLDHESEIDRETLEADGGDHDGGGATGDLAEFSGEANSAIVDCAGHGQCRQATSMTM
jgi:hypothetical protein